MNDKRAAIARLITAQNDYQAIQMECRAITYRDMALGGSHWSLPSFLLRARQKANRTVQIALVLSDD